MLKIQNKKKFAMFVVIALLLISGLPFGIYRAVKLYKQTPQIEKMNIDDAAKKGEKKTVQLLIKIDDASATQGGFERGDVVLSADENKEFSLAEQEGFLILKIRLTEDQQQLLALSLNEKPGVFANEEEAQNPKMVKNRKFAVDLEKAGITSEQKTGKIISDKVFEDDILYEKK